MRRTPAWTSVAVAATVTLTLPAPAGGAAPEPSPEQIGLPPSEPPDDAPPEARAEYWFGQGETLGEAGDFVGSAKAFERSVEIMRTGAGLYNRAVAYEYGEMFLQGYSAYEDYRDFVDPRSAEALAATEGMARMRERLGTIELGFHRDQVPKQIFVDGDPRERDAFPLLVKPGQHEVVVVERDGEERRRSYSVQPGGVWTVDFTRPTQTGQGPAFKPPPAFGEIDRDRRRRIVRSLFYASAGLTAASGVTLGVFGGLVLREKKAFAAALCGSRPACLKAGDPSYPADHESRFENYKLTTNVMVGVTAGLAGITLVLGIVGFSRTKPEGNAPTGRMRFEPGSLRMRF